jgi:hypothetical protein
MTIGFKVSLPGKSITSTNPQDYVVNSDHNTVMIYADALATVVVPTSSTALVTIPHDLGYIPMADLFIELTPGSGRWYNAPFWTRTIESTQVLDDNTTKTSVTSSNIHFTLQNNTGSSLTIQYHYYIYADQIS